MIADLLKNRIKEYSPALHIRKRFMSGIQILCVEFGAHQFIPAENVQWQVAVAIVVPVEETSLSMSMKRIFWIC